MVGIAKWREALDTNGNVAIEFGFILPVLLMLTFGIIDFGRYFWTETTLTRAVEAAARCAAVKDTLACPDIPAYAKAQAWGISGVTFTLKTQSECVTDSTGKAVGVKVSATYDYKFMIPFFNPTKSIGASSCYTCVNPAGC